MRAFIISFFLISIVAFVAVLWWQSIKPSNDRDWAPDVARMTTGERAAEAITLHNVRNFTWRSETDIDERWETRHYDLAQLSSVDLIVSYWTIPAIAHTLVSFGFDDDRHVVFSVEIRKEKVFLFRTQLNAADRRALFLAYVDEANTLAATPRFYHTLTANCTTIVFGMMQRIIGDLPWDYRLLASGYLPNYVYDLSGLDTRYDFATLERMGYVSRRVNAALSDAAAADANEASGVEFSRAIRVGIPELSGKN